MLGKHQLDPSDPCLKTQNDLFKKNNGSYFNFFIVESFDCIQVTRNNSARNYSGRSGL